VAQNHQTGTEGEDIAEALLRRKGFRILHRNWSFLHLEIDIAAMDGEELVIVEVKTRGTLDYGDPQSFVTRAKQKKLIRAANHFIDQHDFKGETRFDVVAVLRGEQPVHIENAFRPIEQ